MNAILDTVKIVKPGEDRFYPTTASISIFRETLEDLYRDSLVVYLRDQNRKLTEDNNELLEETKQLAEMVQRLTRKLADLKRRYKLYDDEEEQDFRKKVERGRHLYLDELKRVSREKQLPLIRYYRLLRSMTQGELAEKVGEQQPHISRWESGEVIPNLENLSRLAGALGVTLDQLLGRED